MLFNFVSPLVYPISLVCLLFITLFLTLLVIIMSPTNFSPWMSLLLLLYFFPTITFICLFGVFVMFWWACLFVHLFPSLFLPQRLFFLPLPYWQVLNHALRCWAGVGSLLAGMFTWTHSEESVWMKKSWSRDSCPSFGRLKSHITTTTPVSPSFLTLSLFPKLL